MKEVKTCKNCGKPIPGKATYCGDKCRMAFKRSQSEQQPEQNTTPNTNKPEQIDPEQPKIEEPEQLPQLTRTDRTFYDRAIRDGLGGGHIKPEDYYHFSSNRFDRTCLSCGLKFKTSLKSLRYCSYKHYSEELSGV